MISIYYLFVGPYVATIFHSFFSTSWGSFFSAFILIASLATASPTVKRRQTINFDTYDTVPVIPDVAAPAGDVAPQPVTYDAAEVAQIAAADIIDSSSSTGAEAAVVGRDLASKFQKRVACAARTPGSGPAVSSPDDSPKSFQQSPAFNNAALGAKTPVGYDRVVLNALVSAQDPTYMIYKMLTSYDPLAYATFC